jgi:serine protease Do
VRIGNSDSVQVGDWAVAIGSPFGLEATVTAGIVSATGRDIEDAKQFQKFIQTDAPINPGNSGGPLLNIEGEVIGVNTAIATDSGGYQGIGFALPINVAAGVYNSIIKNGRVMRGSIGVGWDRDRKTQSTILKAFGFRRGLLIESVQAGGPAEKSGLMVDDVVLDLNGKPVRDGEDLVSIISNSAIGSEIVVGVDRQGQKLQKRVKVEDRSLVFKDRSPEEELVVPTKPTKIEPIPVTFGLELKGLTAGKKTAASIESGVEVNDVQSGSLAEEIGLERGDLILAINRVPIAGPEDVRSIRSRLKPGDAIAFRVLRKQGTGLTGGKYVSRYVSGLLPAD